MTKLIAVCPTCGARFRSNKQRLLGQIVACPKCGGMMQVERAAEDGESPTTKTEDAIDEASTDEAPTEAETTPNDAPAAEVAQESPAEPPRSTRRTVWVASVAGILLVVLAAIAWQVLQPDRQEPQVAQAGNGAPPPSPGTEQTPPEEVVEPSDPTAEAPSEEDADEAPPEDGEEADGRDEVEATDEANESPDEAAATSEEEGGDEQQAESDEGDSANAVDSDEAESEEPETEEADEAEPALSETLPTTPEETARALATPITGVKTGQAPLAAVLRDVASMSRVAFGADWPALALAGFPPEGPLPATLGPTTLSDVLQEIADRTGSRLEIGAGWARLTRAPPPVVLVWSAPEPAQQTAWETALRQATDLLGATVQFAPTPTGVETTFSGSAASAWACLRLWRSLEAEGIVRITNRDQALSGSAFDAPQRMSDNVTITWFRPTAMSRVVQSASEIGGVQLLVDWASLADAGVSPATLTTFSVQDRPWSEALESLLETLNADFTPVGANSMYVSTPTVIGAAATYVPASRLETLSTKQEGISSIAAPDGGAILVATPRVLRGLFRSKPVPPVEEPSS